MAGEPLAMAGRMLADLGADVIKLEPRGGDPLRRQAPLHANGTSLRFLAFNAGKSSVEYRACEATDALLAGAQLVIETPGFPGALELDRGLAPNAVWLKATPFGLDGPRSEWRASDLGLLAAGGNLFATGFTDRPPVRCAEPAAYAHAASEAVFALLTAFAGGGPRTVDLAMSEVVMLANMCGAGQFPTTGRRGNRMGASMGATREIWRCADGFVSFGLRGGPSRAHNFDILLAQMAEDAIDTSSWEERDWLRFNAATLGADELADIERPLAEYFARHSMTELYNIAVRTNLMLAPANGAAEILAGEQLAARKFFSTSGDTGTLPARFAILRDAAGEDTSDTAPASAPPLGTGPVPEWPSWEPASAVKQRPWEGLKLLEFGSGAAGPIASRYFVEQGATVVKVESTKYPDFLRVMSRHEAHGLESSSLFNALNPGKQSVTLNLRDAEGIAVAKSLFHWADAVIENFAPKAMRKYGLDYASMVAEKPDLVMLSTCLNGQTGPHRDYPGFGGQGAALCGFNYLTGWPDREPIGPFGTITDSLSPRFAASALAASLLHQRRTGEGAYIDLAQVETGAYSLAPWLLEHTANGTDRARNGNRHTAAAPHGVFPCKGDERWIAIACWSDEEWRTLADIAGFDAAAHATLDSRLQNNDTLEALLAAYTQEQDAETLADKLQSRGVEAVPVADFGDLFDDSKQLATRGHFLGMERTQTGLFHYERNGYRLGDDDGGYPSPTPLLGEHTEKVLREQLGYSEERIAALRDSGALD